jgi:hypothetical protein
MACDDSNFTVSSDVSSSPSWLIRPNSDRIAAQLRKRLDAPLLTLPQVLESATWKGGREIARIKRPESGGPPIEIESDGTVF